MNKRNLLAKLVYIFNWMSCGLMLLVSASSASTLLRAGQAEGSAIADIPEGAMPFIERFLAVINSGEAWEIAPLMRPDQSREEAIAAFLNANPGFVIIKNNTKNPVKPIMDQDRYVLWEYLKPNKLTWIILYGRVFQDRKTLLPSQSESALWVKSGNAWRLVGYGWPLERSRAEAEKVLHEKK